MNRRPLISVGLMRTKRSFSVAIHGCSPARSASSSSVEPYSTRDVVVVGLEQHLVVRHRAEQFGAFGGAEQHRALLDDEVHREDLQPPAAKACHVPAERDTREQVPALVFIEHGDGFAC